MQTPHPPTHIEDEEDESEKDGSVESEEETPDSNDADLGTQYHTYYCNLRLILVSHMWAYYQKSV
jgi:hypothetical protein